MTITVSLPPRPSETPEFTADGQKVQEMGSTLRTSSSIFDDHGSFVGGKAKDSGLLDGDAAAAYAQALNPIGKHADACSLALRAAANAVLGHGDELVDLKRRHQDLKGERERLTRQVDALTARANPLPTDEAELRNLQSDCDRCTDQVETYESDLVKWAEDLRASEEKVAAALRDAMTERQIDQKYAGVADPADTARDSMPSSKDPKAVKAWWDGLTEEQRAGMTAAYPEIVGNTDGIPAADRSDANTISLDRDLAELGAIPEDQRTDDEQTRYDNAKAADVARDKIERSRDPMTNENYDAQVYIYDPMAFGGDGRVAMAVGDLDTASNVSVSVPGLTTDMESSQSNAEDVINLHQAASFEGGTSTATMFWIGYDAPSGADSAGVAAEGMATAGGERLADTLDGLNAMRSDDFHLTAIGHSYGSTTVAHAMTDGRPDVDDVVLLGSPGAGDDADSADDLGVGSGHVFVGTNSEDLVGRLGQTGWVSPAAVGAGVLTGPLGGVVAQMAGAGLGHNPAEDDFGAVRFQAESTSRGSIPNIDDHVKYYDHDSESLANMAHIVNGQYDEVVRAGQVHDPWYRDPVDPESDRSPSSPDTDGQ
ncbi:alpha/beta hydrolase family protein [Nocardioides sp. NBC_00850]|uniref:alpha/beta hydrolase n=1 Tax=Nocardioides sp. NBC_00850 TaxID=2976001 RepID=UPI003867E4AD|nr:alpha/beta hydrolase family protein [Nocardioides sp. NBC_00850]